MRWIIILMHNENITVDRLDFIASEYLRPTLHASSIMLQSQTQTRLIFLPAWIVIVSIQSSGINAAGFCLYELAVF